MANDDGVTRRDALIGAAAVASLAACSRDKASDPAPATVTVPDEPNVVRVASVSTAVEGGVLPALVQQFEAATKMHVRVTSHTGVYDLAREGKVDLVISHYGHKDAERFVLDGLGEFPRLVFSNQMALFGPPADPAGVRGLEDLAEAFRRIAAAKTAYLLNRQDGVAYLTDILWNAIGKPDRTGWLLDGDLMKDAAVVKASETGAYVLWGLTPFLRLGQARALVLEPLVLADPLLQRVMCSVVVKPGGVRNANVDGAHAFQSFLLEPATQAQIRSIHYPGKHVVSWTPAGRHNRTAILPKG